MAGDFLSQEEVDALLKGVCSESDDDYCEVSRFDMNSIERIVSGEFPNLENINEYFARLLRIEYYKKFQRQVEISIGPVRYQQYSKFMRNLVTPTGLNLIKFSKGLDGESLIVLDPNLIFLTVDNVFGGDGRFHTRVEGRDFSYIENEIIDELLIAIKNSYIKSFSSLREIDFDVVKKEQNCQFIDFVSPRDYVLSTTFTIELGGATSDFHICLPKYVIEPIFNLLKKMQHKTKDLNLKKVNLNNIKHTLVVEANCGFIDLIDVKNLKENQFFEFKSFISKINEKDFFVGELNGNVFKLGEKSE